VYLRNKLLSLDFWEKEGWVKSCRSRHVFALLASRTGLVYFHWHLKFSSPTPGVTFRYSLYKLRTVEPGYQVRRKWRFIFNYPIIMTDYLTQRVTRTIIYTEDLTRLVNVPNTWQRLVMRSWCGAAIAEASRMSVLVVTQTGAVELWGSWSGEVCDNGSHCVSDSTGR